jgi:CubicO group peptidase (beta-lactamase class C family)
MTPRRRFATLVATAAALVGCGGSATTQLEAPGPTNAPAPGAYVVSTTTAPPETAPASAHRYPAQPAGVPFPTREWPVGELPPRIDRATLDRAVDAAFGAADATSRVQSIVVVQGGRIVYERYHPLDGPDEIYPSFSMAKSMTSALIGLLVSDGTLTLDEHPDVPQWRRRGDPRRQITLRNLLQMSSGLQWDEVYEQGADVLNMLQAPNAAAYVASKPLESKPGTVFEYSTGTTALLSGIAADALGGCAREVRYLRARLFEPIGITTDRLLRDPRGCWYGGLGADMTTRDFARFGLLYLRDGTWDGEQIVPTEWVDETRDPATTNPEYGLHWWLGPNGRSFQAEGLFGQRIVVVPRLDLVIAANSTAGSNPYTMIDTVRALFAGEPVPGPPVPPTLPASL